MSTRKRKGGPASGGSPRSGPRSRRSRAHVAGTGALIVTVLGLALVLSIVHWLRAPRVGSGHSVGVQVREGETAAELAGLLQAAGVIDRSLAFELLLLVAHPVYRPAPGPHLLTDDLAPGEVLRRLVRLSSRDRIHAVIPEGFNRFQIGERFEALRVCSARAFEASATNPGVVSRLGLVGSSTEGYLFPATYDLFRDSDPDLVVAQMVAETKKRLLTLRDKQGERFSDLDAKYGFREREILTLASVVEKEAARAEELPIIASVFFNRLSNPEFRPLRSLQSDPTAAYGCLVSPELNACRGFSGKVLPAMLRDADNAYNTYRHPGLPPGPIANPGERAVEAVLGPASTDYLFFVAAGDGRHAFSRTLEEHETYIHAPRK